MGLERDIAAFPHNFKDFRRAGTAVVWHNAPLKIMAFLGPCSSHQPSIQPANFLTQQPLYLNKYGLHCYVIYSNLYSSKKSFLSIFFFRVKIPCEGETKLTIETLESTIKTFQL